MLMKRKQKRPAAEMEGDLAKARDDLAKADAEVARLDAELADGAALSAAEHSEAFAAATAARARSATARDFIAVLEAAIGRARQAEAVAALAARRETIDAKVTKFSKDYEASYAAVARRIMALLRDAYAIEREVEIFNRESAEPAVREAAEAAGVEILPLRGPDALARAMEIDGRMRAPDRKLHDEVELPGWRETDPPYRVEGTWRRPGMPYPV